MKSEYGQDRSRALVQKPTLNFLEELRFLVPIKCFAVSGLSALRRNDIYAPYVPLYAYTVKHRFLYLPCSFAVYHMVYLMRRMASSTRLVRNAQGSSGFEWPFTPRNDCRFVSPMTFEPASSVVSYRRRFCNEPFAI